MGGDIESAMTLRILKSSISTLEAFNDVRNNQSLAHDNPMLNYEEALLIFNHVAASVRFLRSIERRSTQPLVLSRSPPQARSVRVRLPNTTLVDDSSGYIEIAKGTAFPRPFVREHNALGKATPACIE